MNEKFPALEVALKTGDEPFRDGSQKLDCTLLDFWRWSASDLTNNALRGVLAEYIVALALGLTKSTRVEWDAHDLVTPSGAKIEIKSAAYLQSWAQAKLSKISFGIRQTQLLSGESRESKRQAQIYVFCLLHHQEQTTLDPLDLKQWTFYLVPTEVLDEKRPGKTLTLSSLLQLNPIEARFDEIAACVEKLISLSTSAR